MIQDRFELVLQVYDAMNRRDVEALVVRHSVRGVASGAEVQRREVHLWRVEDDWAISLREFLTLEEARAAAG